MEHYQQKRMKSYVLPEAVYRQALWATKDLPRMNLKLEALRIKAESICSGDFLESHFFSSLTQGSYKDTDKTGELAVSLVLLKARIEAVEKAFLAIPEPYRKGIENKIIHGISYGDEAHLNTWKKWQQVFIYHVAKNLNII